MVTDGQETAEMEVDSMGLEVPVSYPGREDQQAAGRTGQEANKVADDRWGGMICKCHT